MEEQIKQLIKERNFWYQKYMGIRQNVFKSLRDNMKDMESALYVHEICADSDKVSENIETPKIEGYNETN